MNYLSEKLRGLLAGGFFYVLFGGTLSKLVAFFSSLVVVRLLDKASYAALSYADNIFFYVTLLSGLGMTSAVLKYCVQENEAVNKAYYKFALKYGSIFQILIIGIVVLVVTYVEIPFERSRLLIYLLVPYGFLYYWYNLFLSFLRTRFENKKYALSSFFQILFTFILCICLVPVWGVYGVAYARALATFLSIVCFTNVLKQYFLGREKYCLSFKKEIYPFLILSISFLLSNLFSMIMPANETFLINNLIRNEVISANYKVANLIPSQLPFVTSTIMVYYFPIFAQKANDADLWKKIKLVGFFTAILNVGIVIAGIILTPHIIRIAYGNAYLDTIDLSIILWGVYLLNAGFRMIPMNILPALGYIKFNLILSVVSSIIHFGLDYLFISMLGIQGAIFATAIIYFISGALYWLYLYHVCKEKNNV